MTHTFPPMPAIEPTLSANEVSITPTSILESAFDHLAPALFLHQTFDVSPDFVDIPTQEVEWISPLQALRQKSRWSEKAYREAYAEAAVEQGIAWQVRLNRERRNMSQAQLAKSIGTQQSAISRMEDPEYGAHSLTHLMKVAHAFDCALIVKLAAYSTLAVESHRLSKEDLLVLGYEQETQE